MAGVRQGSIIALVFAGSAGIAALLFAVDARKRAAERGPDPPPAPLDEAAAAADPVGSVVNAKPPASGASAPPPGEPPPPADDAEEGPCPRDMILVRGDYCPFVAHRCAKKRDGRPGEEPTCERFRNEVLCEGALVPMHFCIDRYEYPNRRGVLPAVLVDFVEAERACAVEDKRLCTKREWTFACEGEAVVPYPTGLERGAVCNWDVGSERPVAPTRGPGVAALLEVIDGRVPAGDRAACTSPFGVHDLGGNVAEWVFEPSNGRKAEPFASVIAGGAWGRGPATCRTLADSHPPPHRAASLGFRCCADPFGPPPGERSPHERRKGSGLRPVLDPRGLP